MVEFTHEIPPASSPRCCRFLAELRAEEGGVAEAFGGAEKLEIVKHADKVVAFRSSPIRRPTEKRGSA